jgi:putative ABC transport system permease protein
MLNARRFLRRTRSVVLTLFLCGALALASATVAHGGHIVAESHLAEGSALRQIELESFSGGADVRRLTAENLRVVARSRHVTSVEPVVQASFSTHGRDEPPILLYAPPVRTAVPPPVVARSRADVFPLAAGEAVLPANADGFSLKALLGRTVSVDYTKRMGPNAGTMVPAKLRIVGLYDASWQVDGPGAAYLPLESVLAWAAAREGVSAAVFERTVGFTKVTVVVDSRDHLPDVVQALQDQNFFAYAVSDRVRELPGLLSLFRWFASILLGVLVVLGVIAGFGLGGAVMSQRVREVGLLRALGKSRGQVLRGFVAEFLLVGVLAGILAVVCGSVLGALATRVLSGVDVLRDQLPTTLTLPSPSIALAAVLLPPLAVLSGCWLPLRRATHRIEPSVALRDW